jgi:hypothetical protein
MPRVTQLVSDLAARFGLDERTLAGKARALREAGMLTSGGHGVNAPDASYLDGARLLLAVLADGKTVAAVDDVQAFAGLPLNVQIAGQFAFDKAETAVAALLDGLGQSLVSDAKIALSNGPLRVEVRGAWEGEPFHLAFDRSALEPDTVLSEPWTGIHKSMAVSGERLCHFAEVIAGARAPGVIDCDEEWGRQRFGSESAD